MTCLKLVDPDFAGEDYIKALRKRVRVITSQEPAPRLLIDLSQVRYLSSAAIGELLGINRKITRNEGQFRIAGLTPEVQEIFTITRMDKVMRIDPSVQEALKKFK